MEIPLLTPGESKVYKSLVELGESSIGNIIKISAVSHSKIYDILRRLASKGLVSSINKNGKQYFSAADPKSLIRLLKDEREKLDNVEGEMEDIVNQLNVRKNSTQANSVLSSFEGLKGMMNVLDEVLDEVDKGDTIWIIGTPKKIVEQAGGYLKDWQQKRIKKGVLCKILGDEDAPSWDLKWWNDSKKKKLTFTKKSTSVSPSYFVITDKSVTTIYFAGNILSFKVIHPEIADRYKSFFNRLWKS